jgi:hypothetical protein
LNALNRGGAPRAADDVQRVLDLWLSKPNDSDWPALYQEHAGLSLAGLLAELRRQTPDANERDDIDQRLAEVVGGGLAQRRFTEQQTCDDAIRVIDALFLPRWRGNYFFYTDCPTC